MTITLTPSIDVAEAKDPKELIDAETFELLVDDLLRYHPYTRRFAERVIEQALVFLKAHADTLVAADGDPSKWVKTAPSKAVDQGWHAFILRSKAYVAFCQDVAGRYMHHLPVMDEDIRSGAATTRAVELMETTGYPVDMEFWDNASCCPENCACSGA